MSFFGSAKMTSERVDGIYLDRQGAGPPILFLHGFPQTHLMWRDLVPRLTADFTVVCADLPGYGASRPTREEEGTAQSKRAMATALRNAMMALGFERFAVVGHDRGGRVAYRMALDWPDAISRLVVLDVVPTAALWDRADDKLMLSFWPFSLLSQPAPLPEQLMTAAPAAIVDAALGNWGTPVSTFPTAVRDAYVAALRDPAQVHAICEEYRAASTIDRAHDHDDLHMGHRIACPLLVLWSETGGLNSWYESDGGPLGLWSAWAERPEGEPVRGGHFFPEEYPAETADRIRLFLTAS